MDRHHSKYSRGTFFIWTKLVVLQILFVLHATCCSASFAVSAVNFSVNPFELPVLPDNLPDPADMPVLNRYVSANKTYEVWPKAKKIPRYLWLAVKDEKAELPPHILALFKRNNGWMPQVCDNDCKDAFIDKYWAGTSVQWAYNNIVFWPSRADVWRYATLYTYGGIYIDDDADFTTNFDDIIRPEDSLLLSEEGVSDLNPIYEADYHLSDAAFYRRFEKLFNNPDYDKDKEYFQGLRPIDAEVTPDITIDERAAAEKRLDEFIVPLQRSRVQTPVFFHGATVCNWGMFAAPRHPLYARTLANLVELVGSMFQRHSTGHLHIRQYDKPHKIMLSTTNFVLTYSLREMLADGA